MTDVTRYSKNFGGIFQGEEDFREVVLFTDYAALREELDRLTNESFEADMQRNKAQAENARLREALNPLVAWAKLVTMDWTADDDDEIDADMATIDKAQAVLDDVGTLVDTTRFEHAPCYRCGYNGPGYYQPDAHPCAKQYHAQAALDTREEGR